jgi:hypothetical protein
MKTLLIALSVGFGILGLAGAASGATMWLSWLVVVLAAAGAIAAIVIPRTRSAEGSVSGALALGAGILWIIGLATRATGAMNWWTFAFGVAFALFAAAEAGNFRSIRATT